jgi:hypothetical protein
MDDNVMHIFGFVIKPIHVSVFYNSIFLLMGAGGIYAWFKTRWQSRGNRDMHRYVHSVNEVSDVDREGYRTLKLRNLGMVEHVDTIIRGDKVRKWLIAAAFRCDWVHRFIKDSNPKHQGAILEAARNVLIAHFADGVLAHLLDLSTFEKKVLFSLTGSDTDIGGVRMIRNVIASEDILHIAQEHPADKWRFENEHHKARLQTLRDMAKAHFEDGGYRIGENSSKVLIIGEAFARIRI